MSFSGAILVTITFLTILVICLIAYLFKYKKWKWKWYYTSLITLVFFLYFLFGRYIYEVKSCIDFNWSFFAPNKQDTMHQYYASILVSKAFLLDMCPFLMLIISFFSIFKWTQKFAAIIAPIGLWTGISTISLAISTINEPLCVQYVFLGYDPNLLFFMMHYMLVIMGMIYVLNKKWYKWYELIIPTIFVLIYIAYVFLIHYLTGANWNLTGLVKNDWLFPGYSEYYQLGFFFNLHWPTAPVFLFLISMLMVIFICELRNLTSYWNKKYFYKKKLNKISKIVVIKN